MDAYLTSLEPDTYSTSTWMRTRGPLVDARNKVQSLGDLLGERLEHLASVAPGAEADGLRKGMRGLCEVVGEWVGRMEKMD